MEINQSKSIESGFRSDHEIFWTEGFESPHRITAKSGNIVLATERGLRETNQDVLILDIEHDAFAVVDGMGGYERGEAAAAIVAEAIKDDFIKPEPDPKNLQKQAYLRMRENGLQGGTTYLAGRIERNGKELTIYQAGNCGLIIVDRRGNIKFSSEPQELNTAPTGRSPG